MTRVRRREFLQAAVLAVPVLLGGPPRRAPLALATADTEDFVAIVGLAGGRRRPATPLGSYNVQQAAKRVLTPSLNHGTLTVPDPDGRIVRHVRVAPAAHDASMVR